MKDRRHRKFDLLAVGELLVDFISLDFTEHFERAENFKRLLGGSPANLCMNMARLGNSTRMAATVGNDDMGRFLLDGVQKLGVNCELIKKIAAPSTLILVTRSKEVSNFEAYRTADQFITSAQLPEAILANTSIFHTTCFALSKKPAQVSILNAAKEAASLDCQLSIDANYAGKIWPDQRHAQDIVAQYCSYGALVKISEVDWERLYGSPIKDPNMVAHHFLDLGARAVCVTLGSEGCYAATATEQQFLAARKVEVKDTTGAGDAFWSGYLTAWLDDLSLLDCCKAGRRMAELKLGHFGPLPEQVDKGLIYEDVATV